MNGDGFIEEIESNDNREQAKELFEKEFCTYFEKDKLSTEEMGKYIHDELLGLEKQRIVCVEHLIKIKEILGDQSCSEYIFWLHNQVENNNCRILECKKKEKEIERQGANLIKRCTEWRESYNELPWYVRLFKFVPAFKQKITIWTYKNMQYDELEFLSRDMNIDEIEEKYLQKIKENDRELVTVKNEISSLEAEQTNYKQTEKEIYDLIDKVKIMFEEFSVYNIYVQEQNFYETFDISKMNDCLDKIRYIEFWLATHYYEARWLSENNPISEKQKGKTFENVLDKMYRRLAMLTPCMVMTCYMLPKQFLAYDGNDKTNYYMYDYADLLIVDEAGQISPEIGVPAFAFAKKAIVVGDEQQIPPVWGTVGALDIAMAISNGVIRDKQEYTKVEENGLNCSMSSIMKIASRSCKFEKYNKGLFLSEHRRCYNEIVQYCNDLVYNGNLEPLRGSAQFDTKYILKGYLPPMGHKQIDSANSQKVGTSRQNKKEAEEIISWLRIHYPVLMERYQKTALEKKEEFDSKGLIGIITPFKGQSYLIQKMIIRQLPEYADTIAVGTVHTFQGAERKVILFSSVYGNKEGCYFINKNESLMNVAVSRAKDSFLVFGDSGCLVGNDHSAGVMLKRATEQEIK